MFSLMTFFRNLLILFFFVTIDSIWLGILIKIICCNLYNHGFMDVDAIHQTSRGWGLGVGLMWTPADKGEGQHQNLANSCGCLLLISPIYIL